LQACFRRHTDADNARLILTSQRFPGLAPAETAWRERPSVAAGEIADTVKNRGRSRHGCPLSRRARQRGVCRAAHTAARSLHCETIDTQELATHR
jgi:hypothetical protein